MPDLINPTSQALFTSAQKIAVTQYYEQAIGNLAEIESTVAFLLNLHTELIDATHHIKVLWKQHKALNRLVFNRTQLQLNCFRGLCRNLRKLMNIEFARMNLSEDQVFSAGFFEGSSCDALFGHLDSLLSLS